MSETTARIRWEDSRNSPGDPAITGNVGDLYSLFKIWPPEDPGDEWLLTSALPGKEGERLYGFPIDLKLEAERWLEEFIASLGVIFMDEKRRREIGWRIDQVIGWAKDGRRGDEYAMDVEKVDRMREDILSYAFGQPAKEASQ